MSADLKLKEKLLLSYEHHSLSFFLLISSLFEMKPYIIMIQIFCIFCQNVEKHHNLARFLLGQQSKDYLYQSKN